MLFYFAPVIITNNNENVLYIPFLKLTNHWLVNGADYEPNFPNLIHAIKNDRVVVIYCDSRMAKGGIYNIFVLANQVEFYVIKLIQLCNFINQISYYIQLGVGWRVLIRAGVKYVLSNTNINTKIWIFQIQIQIQIFSSTLIQIQIQIQIHRFKYKYKYVQPNISAETVRDPK